MNIKKLIGLAFLSLVSNLCIANEKTNWCHKLSNCCYNYSKSSIKTCQDHHAIPATVCSIFACAILPKSITVPFGAGITVGTFVIKPILNKIKQD